MMAEKRENSVLFSLRELRSIEEDRIRQEEDDARRMEEEAQRAQEEVARQVREDEERRLRDAEEAERRRVEDAEKRVREEQLRLEEAERRARVEGQMRLEEQRLKMEIEAKALAGPRKKSTGLIAASGFLVLVVIGLGAFAYIKHKENQKVEAQRLEAVAMAQEAERAYRQLQGELDTLARENEQLEKDYKQINEIVNKPDLDADQKKALEARMRDVNARMQRNQDRQKAVREKIKQQPKPRDDTPKLCPPGQPIC